MNSQAHGAMKHLSAMRLLIAEIFEPVIRLAGWAASAFGKDRDGAEMRIRGKIPGGPFGWRIGRNVRFVGPHLNYKLGRDISFYGDACLNANGPNGFIEIGAESHVEHSCVLYG